MPEDSRNPHTHQGLEHISEVIRQKYPEATTRRGNKRERRWRSPTINQTTATILACIIFVVATPAAFLFLANDKSASGLAMFLIALTAAFAPKLYVAIIQPKQHNSPANTVPTNTD